MESWSLYQLNCQKIDGELSVSLMASCWHPRKDAGSVPHVENATFHRAVNHQELLGKRQRI